MTVFPTDVVSAVRRWTSASKSAAVEIVPPLFADDSVSQARTKIAASVGVAPERLCLWTRDDGPIGASLDDARTRLPVAATGGLRFDPFALAASTKPDKELVAPDGTPRPPSSRYSLNLSGESMLLEDVLGSDSELSFATFDDVLLQQPLLAKKSEKEKGKIAHGVLPKLFPLVLQNAYSSPASRAPLAQMAAFAEHAARSLEGAIFFFNNRSSSSSSSNSSIRAFERLRFEATFQAFSVRVPQGGGAKAVDALKDIGGDLLYELFATLAASPELPCIKFQDPSGASTFKLHESAIGTGAHHHNNKSSNSSSLSSAAVAPVPAARLRSWTAPSAAISGSIAGSSSSSSHIKSLCSLS